MDYTLFESTPGNSVAVLPDTPKFTVVAVSNDFLKTTGLTREQIIGIGFFERFPESPKHPNVTGGSNTRASFESVITSKASYIQPYQRYDIQNADGTFTEKYWKTHTIPVLSNTGELLNLIYNLEDITSGARAEKREEAHHELESAYSKFEGSHENFQRAHERIIDILESTTDAFYAVDADFNFTYINKKAALLWNRDRDTLIGKHYWTEFPNAVGSESYKKHYEAIEKGKALHYETVSPLLNVWIDASIYPGTNGGLSVFFRDISERRAAETALRESETKYRTLFDSIDQGFCIIEMIFDSDSNPIDYRFLETNPMFEKQTGLIGAKGKTTKELIPNLESHWFTLYGKVATTGESIRFTEGSEAMDRWFDVFALRIGDSSSRKVALLFKDITEEVKAKDALKKSEENLRNMILQSPIAMAILKGPYFVVEIANDRMYELWGRNKEQLLHKSIFEGLPEVKNQGYEQLLTSVYTTGKNFSALGIPVTLPRDGRIETVYINLLYEAFREADGSISGIMAVASDVTGQVLAKQKIEEVVAERTKELAEANEALHETNKELQRSNQNLEEFAHAASHDLKEPVRKIHFFTNQLKGQLISTLNDAELRSFERIENATKRMGNLIDDLLLYSHVTQRPHETELVDLNEKIQRVLEDLELDIEQKRAIIHVEKLPAIHGYRRQLQQLFQNLIGNALKYSQAGLPPYVHISSSEVIEEGRLYYRLEIKDNGIGFEQKYEDKIFQMFSRLHGKNEYSGTGVGLSIVKKVVENHNGLIRVQSKPGEGSTFRVFLPVR